MKILFFGDSITDSNRRCGSVDAGRVQEEYSIEPRSYGSGFVFLTATQLFLEKPNYYQILNRGISGDRLPQLYARIQLDVWNEKPDVLSILVGYNDVAKPTNCNCTDLARWGNLYRTMIRETQERCENIKIIICEPFALRKTRVNDGILEYAAEAKKIAKEFGLPFVELQEKMDKATDVYGMEACCYDGVHPNLVGSKVIADVWLEVFKEKLKFNE